MNIFLVRKLYAMIQQDHTASVQHSWVRTMLSLKKMEVLSAERLANHLLYTMVYVIPAVSGRTPFPVPTLYVIVLIITSTLALLLFSYAPELSTV
jgi:hypothetical protein